MHFFATTLLAALAASSVTASTSQESFKWGKLAQGTPTAAAVTQYYATHTHEARGLKADWSKFVGAFQTKKIEDVASKAGKKIEHEFKRDVDDGDEAVFGEE